MLTRQDDFIPLIERFEQFGDEAVSTSLVRTRLLYSDPNTNRIPDHDRLDEAKPVIAVRERLGIHFTRGQSHGDAEDERAVSDALSERLGFAPLGVHMMWIEIARLPGVRDDVGFSDGASQRLSRDVKLIFFEEL